MHVMYSAIGVGRGGGGGGGGDGPPKLTFMHGSQVRGLTYNECSLINVANALA